MDQSRYFLQATISNCGLRVGLLDANESFDITPEQRNVLDIAAPTNVGAWETTDGRGIGEYDAILATSGTAAGRGR